MAYFGYFCYNYLYIINKMSTKQSTIDYILDQAAGAGELRARKMFGEYALYCNDRVVALVCDDQLFVKITEAGKKFVGEHYEEGLAYSGAKPSMLINGDLIEDRDWLRGLISITADALPLPKPKKKKVLKK
jgi:TfoX/Sxy family transcriptional regulator of competence genes